MRGSGIVRLGGGVLALAAYGSSSTGSSPGNGVSQSPSAGVVTFAEQPGATPNYIFWLTFDTEFSVANNDQFPSLIWRPMYVFGVGDKA